MTDQLSKLESADVKTDMILMQVIKSRYTVFILGGVAGALILLGAKLF